MSVTETEREKNAAGNAEKETHDPETLFLRQGRNGRNRNCDLEHGDAARENFVLVKIGFSLRLFVLSFGFDLFLLFLVTVALGGVGFVRRARERNFCIEHRSLDTLGLIVTPL